MKEWFHLTVWNNWGFYLLPTIEISLLMQFWHCFRDIPTQSIFWFNIINLKICICFSILALTVFLSNYSIYTFTNYNFSCFYGGESSARVIIALPARPCSGWNLRQLNTCVPWLLKLMVNLSGFRPISPSTYVGAYFCLRFVLSDDR